MKIMVSACLAGENCKYNGGYLYCEMREDGRINISGKAALVGIADIVAEL